MTIFKTHDMMTVGVHVYLLPEAVSYALQFQTDVLSAGDICMRGRSCSGSLCQFLGRYVGSVQSMHGLRHV